MSDGQIVIDIVMDDGDVRKGVANLADLEKTTGKAGRGIKEMVSAMGLVKIASAAFNVLKNSVGAAVSRFDTMRKFPKVMKALGFSATDSQKSINKLSDGIDGLPTKLDDVVSSTQQMTAITGNLDRSTDTVLGLNNAFLASGASADDAARGTQQYNQMLSTGTVDLESWKTLQETMPLALQKTAEAMGYTGKSAQRDLYAALKEGNVTFDQFTDKIIQLGTGTGDLAKLAKENSLGIVTSFGNLKNAISKNVANMITKLDEITQKLTGKTIAGNIDSLKYIINDTFSFVIDSMDAVIPYAQKIPEVFSSISNMISKSGLVDAFQNMLTKAKPILKIIADNVVATGQMIIDILSVAIPVAVDIATAIFNSLADTVFPVMESVARAISNASKNISEAILNVVLPTLKNFGDWFKNNKSTIDTIIPILAGVVAAFGAFKTIGVVTGILTKIAGAIKIVSGVLGVIKSMGILKYGAMIVKMIMGFSSPIGWIIMAITGIVTAVTYLWKTNEGFREAVIKIWEAIKQAFSNAWEFIKGVWAGAGEFFSNLWSAISDAVSAAIQAIKAGWESFSTFFSNLWSTVSQIAVTAWQAISNAIIVVVTPFIEAFMNIWNGMKDGLSQIWEGIKMIASGAWELIKNVILAPVLLLVDLVTGDFEGMKSHLDQIWNNIKNAVAKIWNGIKTYFSGVVSAIVGYAKAQFENLKNALSSIWNTIKSVANNVWSNIKSSISNLISSLVSSAKNTWSNFKAYMSNLWNSIKSTTVAKWNDIKQSVVNIANNIVSGAKRAWENLKRSVSDAVSNVKSTFNRLRDINLYEIGRNIIQGLVNGIANMAGAVRDAVNNVVAGIKNKITSALKIHSPSRWMRDMVGKNIILGIADGITVYAKSAEQASEKAMKKLGDKMTYYQTKYNSGKMSAKTYEGNLKAIKKNSGLTATIRNKLRKELYGIEEDIAKKQKKVNDGITKANTEYLNSTKKINFELAKNIKDTKAEYTKQVNDLAKSIYNQTGLFAEVKVETVEKSVVSKNLKDQVNQFKKWQSNINKIAKTAPKGFVDEIREMGVGSANQVQALASMTSKELTAYVNLWKQKHNLAKQEAIKQSADEKAAMEARIKALTATAKKELDAATKTWKAQLSKLKVDAKDLEKYKGNGKAIGKNIASGLVSGMKSMQGALSKQVKSMASRVVKDMKKSLGIHSPSRVLRDQVGQYIPQGIALGINRDKSVSKAMQSLTGNMKAEVALGTSRMGQAVAGSNIVNNTYNNQRSMDLNQLARIINSRPVQVDSYLDGQKVSESVDSYSGSALKRKFYTNGGASFA